MMSLDEQVSLAKKQFGAALLTEEGKIECFKRFGYNVWQVAMERYLFDQQEHVVPEKMREKWEKERAAREGIATQDTLLEW